MMIPTGSAEGPLRDLTMESYPSRTFYYDAGSGRLSNYTDGLAAVRQAVDVILHTERLGWQIYDIDFGVEFSDLIGEDFDFVSAELSRRISEALMMDDRVTRVGDFSVSRSSARECVEVSFTVESVYGTIYEEWEVAA